ncbi:unnamed protein product [Larinioides sclopetarius]|uniref:Uncharacterized protein n=1 Tax=Larinioides sclopetarius TaxID=280406 RepID=A0AAV1ZL07_9ARAC
MADGRVIRRRREAPERFDYRRGLQQVINFVDNELGNGRAPQRPDDSEWRKQRVTTIKTLNELSEKLDAICVGASYGKATGNGAEILGASGEIIGVIMSLFNLPLGPILKNAGNLTKNAGTFTHGLSNVVESLVSAKYLSDIEKILKVDQDFSRPLAEWLDFSNELDANVQAIFGVSLASEKFHTIMKVFYEFSKFSSSATDFNATMKLMRQGRYSAYIGADVQLNTLRNFFQELSTWPKRDSISVTLFVLSKSTAGLQAIMDGVRLGRYIMGTSSSSLAPSLQGGLCPDIPTKWEVSSFCFFQSINIALSVLSLINAASIIRDGKSKYYDAIKQITRSLAWELEQMKNS